MKEVQGIEEELSHQEFKLCLRGASFGLASFVTDCQCKKKGKDMSDFRISIQVQEMTCWQAKQMQLKYSL